MVNKIERERAMLCRGIPIGNLTSQIFSNIYLDVFDKFITEELKPEAYLRYGDDFVVIGDSRKELAEIRRNAINFLKNKLDLDLHIKNDPAIQLVNCRHYQ